MAEPNQLHAAGLSLAPGPLPEQQQTKLRHLAAHAADDGQQQVVTLARNELRCHARDASVCWQSVPREQPCPRGRVGPEQVAVNGPRGAQAGPLQLQLDCVRNRDNRCIRPQFEAQPQRRLIRLHASRQQCRHAFGSRCAATEYVGAAA